MKRAVSFLQDELETRRIKAEIIYDHSVFIRDSLRGLLNEALQGACLAFLVLYSFLRSFQSALIVITAVPMTVMAVFFLMQLQGLTLNIMSIGGLALGIGNMTDQAIVIIENIFRLRQSGKSAPEAAVQGTNEVWGRCSPPP